MIGFSFYKEIILEEVALLIPNRNEEGVWNITWKWGVYEEEFKTAQVWWKSHLAVEYVKILIEFEDID